MDDPAVRLNNVSFTYPDSDSPVFSNLSLDLPKCVLSLVGQNATGKSTLMLLSAGRIEPDEGSVELMGVDTRTIEEEEARNRIASFVYQNMEFETGQPVGDLMRYVFESGFHPTKRPSFIRDLLKIFELDDIQNLKLQQMSKGQMQRAILAFSLLYGSQIILMDEPIFALEPYQKERALEFISSYSHENDVPVYYSLHEIALTRKYADHILLLYTNGDIMLGNPEETLTDENLKEAYDFPPDMLYRNEHLFRESLLEKHDK